MEEAVERRVRRDRKAVDRFGAFARSDELDEFDVDESESEAEEEVEARAAVAKAARQAGGRGAAAGSSKRTAVDADSISTLLAAAPLLVELLTQEDSVRSITLCCRDVLNLNIAAGGGVELAPVWEAMAQRIKAQEAAKTAAAPAEAADQPQPMEQVSAVEPAPSPPRTRRGKRSKRPPPPAEPSALDVVRAAVLADPAREERFKKTDALWGFRLTAKSMLGMEVQPGGRGNTHLLRGLDVRALAHRRWGDAAQLKAGKQAAEERSQQQRGAAEERWRQQRDAAEALRAEEELVRREELALRIAENRLPADTATNRAYSHYWSLSGWVRDGPRYGYNLDVILETVIARHKAKLEQEEAQRQREERKRLMEDSLKAEGLAFFRQDWRYRCFISSGEADGLEALLAVARRYQERRMEEAERVRELLERLDAAGLRCADAELAFDEWIKTGEGDIADAVQERRLQMDREQALQELLSVNGLLHRQNAERCRHFIRGKLLHRSGAPYTAEEVAQSLLDTLASDYERCQLLLDRLILERLPPMLNLPACQEYVSGGTSSLESAVGGVRKAAHSRAGILNPPEGRPWLKQEASSQEVVAETVPGRGEEPAAVAQE